MAWTKNNGVKGDEGSTGPQGPQGERGIGLEYDWNGVQLGVKRENESEFHYSDLQGPQGPQGEQGEKGEPGEGSINSVNGDYGPDVTLTAENVGAIPSEQKGIANGVAILNADGKVVDANGNEVEGKVKSVNRVEPDSNGDIAIAIPSKTSDLTNDSGFLTTVTKSTVGLGSVQNYGVATQAEAEAGTATNKYMTPQRTAQAITKLAPIPNASKITVEDAANLFTATNVEGALSELFTNVSDGKNLIATAITDKGVSASGSDAFSQLADKINQISTGIKWAKGNNQISNNTLSVSGLGFRPRAIIAIHSSLGVEGIRYASVYVRSNGGWNGIGMNGVRGYVDGDGNDVTIPHAPTENGFSIKVSPHWFGDYNCDWIAFE